MNNNNNIQYKIITYNIVYLSIEIYSQSTGCANEVLFTVHNIYVLNIKKTTECLEYQKNRCATTAEIVCKMSKSRINDCMNASRDVNSDLVGYKV